MNLSQYREEIRKASEGEVIGKELFLRLAANYPPEHHSKLVTLSKLEAVTGGRLDDLIARHGIKVDDPSMFATKVDALVERLTGLTWAALMARFQQGFVPYVDIYNRLEEHARVEDKEALSFLAYHERLLLEFVDAELAGDGAEALHKINSLIASNERPVVP